MAYVDFAFYTDHFKGSAIPENEFERLSIVASDVIDAIVTAPFNESHLSAENLLRLKRATAYQAEHLYQQGGIAAITGFADSEIDSEHLGSYSVSKGGRTYSQKSEALTVSGIPLSALAYSLLKSAGLISRWAYKGTRLDDGY